MVFFATFTLFDSFAVCVFFSSSVFHNMLNICNYYLLLCFALCVGCAKEKKVSLKGYGKFGDAGSMLERQWDAMLYNQMILLLLFLRSYGRGYSHFSALFFDPLNHYDSFSNENTFYDL